MCTCVCLCVCVCLRVCVCVRMLMCVYRYAYESHSCVYRFAYDSLALGAHSHRLIYMPMCICTYVFASTGEYIS